MTWLGQIEEILSKYTDDLSPDKKNVSGGEPNSAQIDTRFEEVAKVAPQSAIATGLAEAFRSDQTPPFAEMVSNLFSQSDGRQKAGLIEQLVGSFGQNFLTKLGITNSENVVESATQVSPEKLKNEVALAEKNDPSIVDTVSDFYSQQPELVKGLGGVALMIMLAKMAKKSGVM